MTHYTDAFNAVFHDADSRSGHDEPRALSVSEALKLAQTYLPELAERAARERRSGSLAVSKRTASWAFAALMWRAAATDRSLDPTEWWCSTDEPFWHALGFPRRPGRAEARQYLARALKSAALRHPAAKALVSVLPDLARSTAFPGSYLDADGSRRVLPRRRAA